MEGRPVYLVGIKGTGMCALAELLSARGARVSGCDTSEVFYTDRILAELNVPVVSFEEAVLSEEAQAVIRSDAYGEDHPLAAEALRRGVPVYSYPEVLGMMSRTVDASAVAGVHGKTTTTALAGTLMKAFGLKGTVVAGGAVAGFGNRSTWRGGDDFLVAETCEYRRNFLCYRPRRIVLTSVESDHQDCFPDYASIRDAFLEFVCSLRQGGQLIYCSDDKGAGEVAALCGGRRPDIRMLPYGVSAPGKWKVRCGAPSPGINSFKIEAFKEDFHLALPGRHIALDAAAALALVYSIAPGLDAAEAAAALAGFRGSRRRSEIVGEAGGVLVMDDYAHHPTAIAATLDGLKAFHPERRLVVDFMPHTYSRTSALLDEFAAAFHHADLLILHPIYASARENAQGTVSGEELKARAESLRGGRGTLFHATLDESRRCLRSELRPGDLFITMGAGNNWPLGRSILRELAA